jgi:hypothetical protein
MGEQHRLIKLAEGQHGLFSLDQVRAQLKDLDERKREEAVRWLRRSGKYKRIYPSVYALPGVPASWEQRAQAALLVGGKKSVLSHQTAAGLHGLEGFKTGGAIHVAVPPNRNMVTPGIKVHRTREELRFIKVRGLRVTTLARTFVDLAAVVDAEKLEFALDSAQRRASSLGSWIDWYVADLKQPHRKGLSALMKLVELRRDGAMDSVFEVQVWRLLRQHGFPTFVKRHIVTDKNGDHVIRLDFAWPELLVALHADGFSWHHQRERMARDAAQRSQLNVLKWRCVTVMPSMLESGAWVEQLRIILAERTELLARARREGRPLESYL